MRVCGGAEILDEQVRVRSEGDADIAVPHQTLNPVRVHAAAQELSCERVPQVVEPDGDVQGHRPEPPSARLGELSAAAIGDLAAGRTEARLGIAGALLVPAPAAAVFVAFHDARAGQGMAENLLRVGLACPLGTVRRREDQVPRCVLELAFDPGAERCRKREYCGGTAFRCVALVRAGDGDRFARQIDVALSEREQLALAQSERRASEERAPVLRNLSKHLPDLRW